MGLLGKPTIYGNTHINIPSSRLVLRFCLTRLGTCKGSSTFGGLTLCIVEIRGHCDHSIAHLQMSTQDTVENGYSLQIERQGSDSILRFR